MSDEENKLSIASAAIDAEGVVFRRNAVVFMFTPSLGVVESIMAKLAELDAGTSWWFGDVGLALQAAAGLDSDVNGDREARSDETEASAIDRRLAKSVEFVTTQAAAMGISAGHLWDCMAVARFFRPSERSEEVGISWAHHQVAMRGAGGPKGDVRRAKLWLRQAAENRWSVSDLRKQVNLALSSSSPSAAPAEENPFHVVDEVDAWLQKRPAMPRVTAEQARAQLTRWSALVTFVRTLEEIAFPK